MTDLYQHIRDIPDYPKSGILFRDITPLLADPQAFEAAIDAMAAPFANESIDVIAAAEARGFIFGTPLALRLGAGFSPVRKPGKLPFQVHADRYDLEYGQDELQVHVDAFQPGQRVLIVDDLLATGGTVEACCRLVEKCGAEVIGCSFLIHLKSLQGEKKLGGRRIESVLNYE
ncbi:adenine phosphoribosyltransferase [bacterium]|nr:adenine phosphoribosyltransferase [bacterium]